MPPPGKRSRNPVDDEPAGPSKVQLKGLSWNTSAAQPAFLRNAYSALSGPRPPAPGTEGRPAIPTRPAGDDRGDDDGDSPDEWEMGDEAPTVVVLNEDKHVGREEMERMRKQAKANSAPDPFAASKASGEDPTDATLKGGSLRLASGSSKDKAGSKSEVKLNESWEDVVKRSKQDAEVRRKAEEKKKVDETKEMDKKERDKKKQKKKQKKQVGLLSFEEEE